MQVLISWQPKTAGLDDGKRFSEVMGRWRDKYSKWCRRDLDYAATTGGYGSIGLIEDRNRADARSSWLTDDACTFGAIEEPREVSPEILKGCASGKTSSSEFTGHFLAAFGQGTVLNIMNAPVEEAASWVVEGPLGVAAGTRVRPLLELVGLGEEPDLAALSCFACFGWVLGEGSFFKGAKRLSRGTCLIFQDGRFETSEYATLAELFQTNAGSAAECLELISARMKSRTGRQAELSADPYIHLSGGRDSRMILAGAARSGQEIKALTIGTDTSDEVTSAAAAAKAVGVPHRRIDAVSTGDIFRDKLDLVRDYVAWSEGMDKVSHLENNAEWFDLSPMDEHETFSGMGGEITRGAFFHKYMKGIAKYLPGMDGLRISLTKKSILRRRLSAYGAPEAAFELARTAFEPVDTACKALGGSVWTWLDLFYFAERTCHWASSARSIRTSGRFSWSPLIDRVFTGAVSVLSKAEKESDFIPHGTITTLCPELGSIGFARGGGGGSKQGYCALEHLIPIYLQRPTAIWPQLMSRDYVEKLMKRPGSGRARKILWQLITVELFIDSLAEEKGRG